MSESMRYSILNLKKLNDTISSLIIFPCPDYLLSLKSNICVCFLAYSIRNKES